jgi:hypothetical protein
MIPGGINRRMHGYRSRSSHGICIGRQLDGLTDGDRSNGLLQVYK